MGEKRIDEAEDEDDLYESDAEDEDDLYEFDSEDEDDLCQTFSRFGLPQVDRLLEEQIIKDPTSKFVATRVVNLDKEDRINRLPDGILGFIVSLLTMREGATTSILSRRWRNIWNTSISHLNFNGLNLFGLSYTQREKVKEFPESLRTEFMKNVNCILQLRRALRMDTLQISFPLDEDHATVIDKCVELAASQRATKLELDFCLDYDISSSYNYQKMYTFCFQRSSSSLNYLHLRRCAIEFPPGLQGLNSLTILNLCQCYLTSDNVQNILSTCCSLEWLSMVECDFPPGTTLTVVGLSIPLKHLNIDTCCNIEKITVHNLNLSSFELKMEDEPSLLIKNVPSLTRLVLDMDGPVKIADNIPCLQTLFLAHEESELPKLSVFNNLRRLVFTSDFHKSNLLEVVWFLEACPMLQELDLDMGTDVGEITDEMSRISVRPRHAHRNLKKIRIYAFDGYPELIELVRYLLKNAIVLEKMMIYRTCKSYHGNGVYDISKGSPQLVGSSLEEVHELFQRDIRSSTKLVIERSRVSLLPEDPLDGYRTV